MKRKEIEDCHGYEIMGLASAKTKQAKRDAIKKHLRWHEDRVSEIQRSLTAIEKELGL